MIIEGKLPLNSPQWSKLDSFGDSGQLPSLVQQLEESDDPGASEVFGDLLDAIYQQYSCCEAAYAVLPYLVELGLKLHNGSDPDLWIYVGQMAGTCKGPVDRAEFMSTYKAALDAAQGHWIKVLLESSQDLRTLYYLSVATIALTQNPLGKLVMDNLFPDKYAESTAVCPFCAQNVSVACFESGYVVRLSVSKRPEPPSPPIPLSAPRKSVLPQASPNPWQAVASALTDFMSSAELPAGSIEHLQAARELADRGLTSQSDPALVFSLLGSLLILRGHPEAGMRYLHAWDSIACSECGRSFIFADRWWGAVK